ncbi:sensor histidine kinase [Nodularia chucula]|uniref:sensor histidine kinase n=1 Tax=Nodularia chucula TaxID=3093667 RepID=UPI0039C73A13
MIIKSVLTSSAFLHDLLNPLIGIKITIKQLMAGNYGHTLEEIRPVLEAVLETNNRVSYLLENYQSGQRFDDILNIHPASIRRLDLFKFLQKLHLEFLPLAKCGSIKLKFEHIPLAHGAEVMADAASLGRMMSNLIHNGIKYTIDGGDVFIRLLNRGDDLIVEIEDTGKGIAPQEIPNIFLPFYRANAQSSGSGLGLYVAMMIAKAHGLKLLVDSSVQEGTKFTIIFPYRAHQPYGLDGTIGVTEGDKNALLKQYQVSEQD